MITALLLAASIAYLPVPLGTPPGRTIDVTAGDGVPLMRVYADGSYACLAAPTPKELGMLMTDGGKWLLIYATACGRRR